ncbi:MAG: hypothetical protein HY329_04760 [Chloroflexi bacterium]|nr:hypothetical protein [Chloroflexota bacterium]
MALSATVLVAIGVGLGLPLSSPERQGLALVVMGVLGVLAVLVAPLQSSLAAARAWGGSERGRTFFKGRGCLARQETQRTRKRLGLVCLAEWVGAVRLRKRRSGRSDDRTVR